MADFLLPIDVARVVPSSEYSSRDGATPSMHIWHHGATTSGAAIEANMEPGGRELSATLAIWNDGTVVGKVPERFRPWTSGSYRWDRLSITSEMANGAIDGWTITDATYEACGRIAAAEYLIYGIPLDRDHHVGHNELYSEKFGWESYGTYCPGARERVDWIVELGRRAVSSGTAGGGFTKINVRPEEDTMRIYSSTDEGGLCYLFFDTGWQVIADSNEAKHLALMLHNKESAPAVNGYQINWLKRRCEANRAALVAATSKPDPTVIARELAPLMTGPIIDAIRDEADIDLTVDQVQAAAERAVRSVFADVGTDSDA